MPDGRVLIAPDDGPLTASPTWVRIDDTVNLVSGFDIHRGRQTELDRTDTGTATVYLNDKTGLFDPANTLSDWYGVLDGKQILLQIYNPVTATWVPQFRGIIDEAGYDVHPATGTDGKPIVANIQFDCVDVFDFLGGCQMAPTLFGNTPPSGSEGTIYYQATPDSIIGPTVDARIIEALTDAGLDSTMWVVFTGNVSMPAAKYDPGDAVLVVIRDAADAEFPGIANCYVDKQGRFVFHGRYSRFDPETVEATTTPDKWDFTRWKVGDGVAIQADSTVAQMRVLSFGRGRQNVVNAAVAWPTDIRQAEIPDQIAYDAASIAAYGYHALPAMEDLQVLEGTTTGNTAKIETQKYAALYVANRKDPRVRVKTLTVKAVHPDDARATRTWAVLCSADISDIMNVNVGYPGADGVGIQDDNHYIEGVTQRVRPLQPIEGGGFDYVEADFDISPAEWSMDTHGVFA